MAVIALAEPVLFTFDVAVRLFTDPASGSEYQAPGGSNVTISDTLGVGLTRIRLLLDAPAGADATWTTTTNYTLTGTGSPTVSSVKVAPDNTYIDLITTAQTAAALYTIAWTGLTGITAGSDTFTAAALVNGGISAAAGCARNTFTGNVLPAGAAIDYYDSLGNQAAGNVTLAVVVR